MGGDAGFLNLAYLIEISVVLNLAYRELKFPELPYKLHTIVSDILKEADQREIKPGDENPEYNELASLILPDGNKALWENVWGRKIFFYGFIKSRLSLWIANLSVILNALILILCTYYERGDYRLDNEIYLNTWLLLFYFLTITSVLPFIFIRGSTLCERFLFGHDGKSGTVYCLRDKMFKRDVAMKARVNNNVETFKVPDSPETV